MSALTIVGLALFLAVLIVRLTHGNRHVRGRLFASSLMFGAYAVLRAMADYGALTGDLARAADLVGPMLLAFGAINAAVALAINPWRGDALPDRFPTIVQDSIVIVLFGIAATAILKERIFAATAVGAVVIGLALQDTLGNLFAGLAIQIEKPFRVGHWVRVAGIDAMVSEITWRATKLRTKTGNFVVVPNSVLSKDTIVNYSEPTAETRIEVEVGASYDVPPNEVKATILSAIRNEPLIAPTRRPEVLLVDFASSSIMYRVRAWTTDFAADEQLKDRVRSAIYYAFRRHGISIPYPIQVEIPGTSQSAGADLVGAETVLEQVSILSSLSAGERQQLAQTARHSLFAAGDVIVKQGEAGSSMFVVGRGEAVVLLEPGNREVARIGPGGFFGEMSLLTGDQRNATVRTTVDSELIEIAVEPFRRFVLANPAAVDRIGEAVARRQAELVQHRAAGSAAPEPEMPQRFLARVRRFLSLGSDRGQMGV
jgi:small-conductance mechanosensitive channel/CRP-like cAMP-binding protein